MKKVAFLLGVALLSGAVAQKSLVEGKLQGIQRIVGETVAVELRGCWVHEGGVRCAFAFSGSRYNTTTSLGLKVADFSVAYTPTEASSTTQAEPQTVRARLLTELETADKGPRLDLSLEVGQPTLVLADFPVPPTAKSLASVRVGAFAFDAVPVAEKLPSEALLEARYLTPEALSFKVGAFQVDFVKIWQSSDRCDNIWSPNNCNTAVLQFRVLNTGREAVLNASWGMRYYVNNTEVQPAGLSWWCDGNTPPKLLKDMSTTCYLRFHAKDSYSHLKDNLVQLLEIRVNDQSKTLRNVYLSKLVQ
ncbi:hypothetical protein [Thermus sp.]|uniref:hypothetical protein n=1 Tax=Thermus sp. TaxID=275 RepID=UPI003D0BD17C